MRIDEVIAVKESYDDDLIIAVQDLMAMAMSKEIKKISTAKFIQALKKQGFSVNTDEVIQAVDASGFASSVNASVIIPTSELPDSVNTTEVPSVDVGDMASSQALSDIGKDL